MKPVSLMSKSFDELLASHKHTVESGQLDYDTDAADEDALEHVVGRARVATRRSAQPEHGIAENARQREHAEAQRDSGQRGGSSSDSASGNDAASAESSGATPQRDAPDDDQHRENTAPQQADETDEAPADDATLQAQPPPKPQPATERPAESLSRQIEQDIIDDAVTQTDVEPPHPATFNRQEGFRAGNGATTKVGRFPEELSDALRQQIAPIVGSTFAEEVSNNCLVSGFTYVKLGIDPHDVDSNTAAVMRAFAQTQPELDALTQEVAALRQTVETNEQALRKMVKVVAETTELVRSAEYAMSYWFHDRVVGLSMGSIASVEDAMLEHEDVVVRTRDEFRYAAKRQRQAELDRQGRRKA